jgi:hypothetical protein
MQVSACMRQALFIVFAHNSRINPAARGNYDRSRSYIREPLRSRSPRPKSTELVPAIVNLLKSHGDILHCLRRGQQHTMLDSDSLPSCLLRMASEVNMHFARAKQNAVSMKLVFHKQSGCDTGDARSRPNRECPRPRAPQETLRGLPQSCSDPGGGCRDEMSARSPRVECPAAVCRASLSTTH